MIKKKYLIAIMICLTTCLTLESCGVFKKDCGCPSPTKASKRR